MSIAGISSQGSGLSQILASLLNRLDSTSSTSTTDTTSTQSSTTSTAASDGGLTGSTKPSLSSMILGVLMGLQNQSTDSSSTNTADSSTDTSVSATSSTGSDAVANLFSAMDSDGDGTVSKSEMESYITGVGGTTDEADELYSQIADSSSDSSSGITETDLENQAPPAPPPGGPEGASGHHHHHQSADSTSSVGNQLLSALDSDSDGTISKDELTTYLTANGGTETEADSLFSSLSSDGTSGITATDIDDAVQNMAASFSTNPYASILSMLDNFNNSGSTTTSATGSTVSVSA